MRKYFPHPRRWARYNAPLCVKAEFSNTGLNSIQEMYSNARGVPGFLSAMLRLDPRSSNVDFLKKSGLIKWSEEGDLLLIPNYHSNSSKELIRDPKAVKNSKLGFEIGAWFIHPSILKGTIFSEKRNRDNFNKVIEPITVASELKSRFDKPWNMTQKEMEVESGKKYLSSPLDITETDLPYLRKMKKLVNLHLKEAYGVTEEDKVDMYFHSLSSEIYATLHLKVTVNRASVGMDASSHLKLDHIIDGLERGVTPKEMLEKKGELFFAADDERYDDLKNLNGVNLSIVSNPFYVKEGALTNDIHQSTSFVDKLKKMKSSEMGIGLAA